MAKRRVKGQADSGVPGMNISASPSRIPNAQYAANNDESQPQVLRVRPGYAKTTLGKVALPPRALLWFKDRGGVNQFMYEQTGSGLVYGQTLPTPRWNAEPFVVSGPGYTLSPVTNLTVSDTSTMTLTWTNPTSAYWAGTKVLRRTDRYALGPDDPDATTVYDGRNATAADSALTVGDTGYYSAYAYSRTAWAVPDTTSGVRTVPVALMLACTTTGGTEYEAHNAGGGKTFTEQTLAATAGWRGAASVASFAALLDFNNGGADFNVRHTEDNGGTWAKSPSATTSQYLPHLAVKSPQRALVTDKRNTYLACWRWNVGDAGWSYVNITNSYAYSCGICVAADGTVVAAGTAGSGVYFFNSSDGGATFGSSVGSIATISGAGGDNKLQACSDGSILFFLEGNGVWRSTDNGANWTKVLSDTHLVKWSVSGANVFITRDATPYSKYSEDSGQNWSNGDLAIASLVPIVVSTGWCAASFAGGITTILAASTPTGLAALTTLATANLLVTYGTENL